MAVIASTKVKKERFPRLIIQLLVSYAVIVSLGVGFFILPSQNAVRMLRQQSLADQTAAVQRYARAADSVLALFANISTAFLSDPSMFALAHGRSEDPNQDYYRILSQLNQYNKLYGNIFNQIYVYESHSDKLLSMSGLSDSAAFFDGKLGAYMSREGYARMLARGTPGSPQLFAEEGTAYVVHTLPFNYPDDRYILVAFSVPLQNFFNISSKYEQIPERYGMYLADSGVFLGDAGDIAAPVAAQAAGLNSSSVSVDELSDEGSLFLIRSARNDRYYYFLMPQSAYNNRMASYSRFQILSLIAFLYVSALIVLFSVWHQYRPLKRLLSEINNNGIDSLSMHDYDMILDYLSGLKKERDEYKNLFIGRNPRLRKLLLSTLITDHGLAEEKAEESLRLLEIDFPHPFYVVIVMDVLDDSELFFTRTDHPERYSMFLIENVLCDLVPEEARRVFFEADGSLVCLLNLSLTESPQATLAALQDKLLFAADFLMREVNLTCRYAVSGLHGSKAEFADAYFEALECARSLHPQDQYVLVCGLSAGKDAQEFAYLRLYSDEQARRLVSALRCGRLEKAESIVRLVFQEAQDRVDVHPLAFKSMCRAMACSFVEVLCEMGIASEALERRLYDLLDADTRTVTPKLMEERMVSLCGDIAGQVRTADADREERLIREIDAYVRAHYADPGLGVTGIAEVFSMSVSSLSGFYGRNSDVGLCKFINRVRIQHACRLLRESPDLPLEEVASKVGYTNTRTFSRVFSAEMQCSPGKYRMERAW